VRNLENAGTRARWITGHLTDSAYERYHVVISERRWPVSRLVSARLRTNRSISRTTAPWRLLVKEPELAEARDSNPPRASRPGGFQVRIAPPLTAAGLDYGTKIRANWSSTTSPCEPTVKFDVIRPCAPARRPSPPVTSHMTDPR